MGGFAEYHVMCDVRSLLKQVSIYGRGSDKAIRRPNSNSLTLSFGCRTRKRHPLKEPAY